MHVYVSSIADELNVSVQQVTNTIKLLEEGSTIPFISRYRKEKTGHLDEEKIMAIKNGSEKFKQLASRKQFILESIEKQGNMTGALRKAIHDVTSMNELEDIYLPFKPKKRTRASMAREKGLEQLAGTLMKQRDDDLSVIAKKFLNDKVKTIDEAISGAKDIMAEWVNEHSKTRQNLRKLFERSAFLTSKLIKGKEDEGEKYRDYFSFSHELKKCPSHRLMAIFRGEREGVLRTSVEPDEEKALNILEKQFLKAENDAAGKVYAALKDAYKRLLQPSLENEFKHRTKEEADKTAIRVFADNLRQLLLMPPLGQKRILALDPGFQSGCKLVCLDEQGNLLHNENIYPNAPQKETRKSAKKISSLVEVFHIEAIAIGNGTAGRETADFVKKVRFDRDVQVFIVDESGASVYSASKIAREEFPDYDVTVRGAVSIGRRLMDPLAELVKIDPKSIGVGQYQHDVNQKHLQQSLNQVVESCVNLVGVNLNTSSAHLLRYISGLSPQLAANIIEWRRNNGPFQSREQLKQVHRLGEKAFEQSAGFLRIPGAENPLDNTAVHPESYHIVKKMAKDLHASIQEMINNEGVLNKIDHEKYLEEDTGLATIRDIIAELRKSVPDPRQKAKVFEFSRDVFTIADLEVGMILPGIVTNITNFGAFVDIGVKQNGLIHISNMADRFVRDPNEIVHLHEHLMVKVIDVDAARNRIQLSLKEAPQNQ